jgi:predicted ATPase
MIRRAIVGIRVLELFGQFSYSLGAPNGGALDSRLVLFYGDNGSGKTTVLRLLYHTLSPEPNRGHRTALVAIPVREFVVTLEDGTEIGVRRDKGSILGNYSWLLRVPGKGELIIAVNADSDGNVIRTDDPSELKKWEQFESQLVQLQLAIYFLTDNRRPPSERYLDSGIDVDSPSFESTRFLLDAYKKEQLIKPPSVLDTTVSELENLLRSQVIAAAQAGEVNIHQIYAGIIPRLLWESGKSVEDDRASEVVITRLRDLMSRSEPFSVLGLMPRLDFSSLIEKIGNVEASKKAIVARVFEPYISSISARLDALASTQEAIENFVRTINEFYSGKRASFDLKHGFQIMQPSGRRLPLRALSSGEKQLLLLFCNTVRARAQATIFIIDEPELSLNVKWQRQLLDALLTIVKGSSVQFVIATHSIELLATQRSAVVQLSNSPITRVSEWSDENSKS